LRPGHKYLGVTYDGIGKKPQLARAFAAAIGKKPNLAAFYADFRDQVQGARLTALWNEGSLPLIAWEPTKTPLTSISSGRYDAHLRKWADDLRDLRVPVAISFAHEMNGDWYSWGSGKNTPAQYVAAYRHVHDVFQKNGATNVIWIWSPNVLTKKSPELKPYWVGAAYADWIGPVGYYEWSGGHTFSEVFGTTMKQIRTFTDRPFLLPETGVPAGPHKPAQIADLYHAIARRPDILGAVWFQLDKERDWRINSDPASLKAFSKAVSGPAFGFDPRALAH
jgi:hypothetical protein